MCGNNNFEILSKDMNKNSKAHDSRQLFSIEIETYNKNIIYGGSF